VLEVQTDARPRLKTSSHRIDQHVRWLQMRGSVSMTSTPPLETSERVVLALRPGNFNKRPARLPRTSRLPRSSDGSAPGRLHARGLVGLFPIVRRPRRIPQTLAFLSRREVEQPVEGAGPAIDIGVQIAHAREPGRHRREREVPWLRQFSFLPRQRR
jgi:hypothetical protein